MTCKSTLLTLLPAALTAALALPAFGQQTNPASQDPVVVFRVDVVSRTTQAINFHHRQGSTQVGLQGSSLAPNSKGEIRVDSKTGATKIDASIEKMPPAASLGEGYLTYVLWAITPEGRPSNLGELMLDGDRARLQGATELQTFGLIVTAEPYYAVTQPSDMIVMEGVVKKDGGTTGTIMPIDAKYELVARGGYLQYLPPADRVTLREAAKHIPLDLMEARQAMAVAKSAGALTYAADTMKKAEVDLYNAESFFKSGADKKKVQSLARHVTQLSEDARLISVKKAEELTLLNERESNERRATALTQTAENEADRRRAAEQDAARKAEEAAAAQRATLEAERRAAEERQAAERLQAQSNAALADKDRQLQLETERSRAALEAERLKQQTLELEAAKARAQADVLREEAAAKARILELETARARDAALAAEQQAAQAREMAAKAEAERTRMRLELVRQFNVVLATRESARGLIVNMSDVLFDTGRYTLKPGAREKLAKISGIILAHPGLKIEVEGHTDSIGSAELNQKLSEQRAAAVRTYLVEQGIASDTIVSRGFGKTKPVADNMNAAGRQANRRVELVVNGPMLSNSEAPPTGGQE
jgi:outer membrane protein OmpA-like peptidoglycan-associated protein